jgi:photosystem II stability/assembly factor-like uncharacterized protein
MVLVCGVIVQAVDRVQPVPGNGPTSATADPRPEAVRWTPQVSGVTSRFRGVSAASDTVAWASGANGTIVHTVDGGQSWQTQAVPDAAALDIRDIDAIDERVAYALSIGPGPASRIFKTEDGGAHWQTQAINQDPQAFLDAMTFWSADHGIVMSDSVDGHFVILMTRDGKTWQRVPQSALPPALPNEGAFAASGTNIAVLTSRPTGSEFAAVGAGGQSARASSSASASASASISAKSEATAEHVWIGTGAAGVARVLYSHDGGRTWKVANTPIPAGPSAGIFSIAFRDELHGVIVGGDYKKERDAVDNVAVTSDGGATWTLVPTVPRANQRAAPVARPAPDGAPRADRSKAATAAPTANSPTANSTAIAGGLSGFRSVAAYVPAAARASAPAAATAASATPAPVAVTASLIAIGPAGADYSTDDGHTWRPLECAGFHAFSFAPHATVGWAVGENGRIARLDGLSVARSAPKSR